MGGYDRGLGAAGAFFTFLITLSLEQIVSATDNSVDSYFYQNRWLLFWIGALLFLRYLLGSAVHLWHEYAKTETARDASAFQRDLYFLLAFGALSITACYQATVIAFLLWLLGLVASAGLWALFNKIKQPKSPWNYWIWINLAQAALLLAGALLIRYRTIDVQVFGSDRSLWLIMVLIGGAICLVWDVRGQVRNLNSA